MQHESAKLSIKVPCPSIPIGHSQVPWIYWKQCPSAMHFLLHTPIVGKAMCYSGEMSGTQGLMLGFGHPSRSLWNLLEHLVVGGLRL